MKKKKVTLTYKIIKFLLWVFYPKIKTEGIENLPDEPSIIVANHSQLHGPIACELHFPTARYTWCAGEMMKLSEVPSYAFNDFWSNKPKRSHWYYKLCSYLIAPLSVCIFNNANTIAVYRDNRAFSTFRNTAKILYSGTSVVIFPEHNKKHNNIIYDFQDKFIDIARLYHKKTGKELCFVPMYIAPKLKKMYIGKPIRFSANSPIDEERRRICDYLMNEITEIACGLPEHTVVPYRNIPKKDYPKNNTLEVSNDEKTGS